MHYSNKRQHKDQLLSLKEHLNSWTSSSDYELWLLSSFIQGFQLTPHHRSTISPPPHHHFALLPVLAFVTVVHLQAASSSTLKPDQSVFTSTRSLSNLSQHPSVEKRKLASEHEAELIDNASQQERAASRKHTKQFLDRCCDEQKPSASTPGQKQAHRPVERKDAGSSSTSIAEQKRVHECCPISRAS
ncbi:MAG: hypothetical protein J3Q66DRAFT_406527 [Benniella sp.]|nr:MAG: hypothetical protein J3Q66DRAFT_406527 [Benniella sp.]